MEPLLLFGGLGLMAAMIGLAASQLSGAARLRRMVRRVPIRPIREARRDEIVRICGIVRSSGTVVPLPFTGAEGVFHRTQVIDSANPGQTSTFSRAASCGFVVEDGTGHARIPGDVKLELIGPEPEAGGAGREDAALAAFMGSDIDRLFSKGGWVVWRQESICVGDEVAVWGRVLVEVDSDASHYHGHFREERQLPALAPVEPGGGIVVERLKRPVAQAKDGGEGHLQDHAERP